MKQIFLIGDSIRKGYDAYIRACFRDVAEVYYPEDNCRFAEYTLYYLHHWAEELEVPQTLDVIHWNAGLWDTLRYFETEPLTPIDAYVGFIERIQQRIERLFPNAVSVFATSTPVRGREYWKNPAKSFRDNKDVAAYNKAAAEVLKPYGVKIDDLFAVMQAAPESEHSDQTHFYTPEGRARIGNAVKRSLLDALGMQESDLRFDGGEFATPESIVGI